MIQWQTDKVRHCQLDRIAVADAGDHILRFVLGADLLDLICHAILGIGKGFAAWEAH